MGRSKQEFKVTKEEIEEVAFNFFSQNGYEDTNLKYITDQMNITRSPIYYYFGDKKGLYTTIAKKHLDEKVRKYRELFDREDLSFFEKMKEHLYLSSHNFLAEGVFFAGIQNNPDLKEISDYRTKALQIIHQLKILLVNEAIDSRVLRPDTNPDNFLLYFLVVCYGVEGIKKSSPTGYTVTEERLDELINIIMNGVINTYKAI